MVLAGVACVEQDGVDLRLAVVAEQVAAVERAQSGVADDVAADDRAVAAAVTGDEDGLGRSGRGALLVAEIALEDAPSVVGAGAGAVAVAGEVDLLFAVLADVADDEIARAPVEGEAPRIAQPVGPDLRTPAGSGRVRVAGRDRVAAAGTGRDP